MACRGEMVVFLWGEGFLCTMLVCGWIWCGGLFCGMNEGRKLLGARGVDGLFTLAIVPLLLQDGLVCLALSTFPLSGFY